MSNVLIGIIGVILFIGLALAGALFLGPRFQSASTTSKAAAILQATKQVSDAAEMYRIQEGRTVPIQGMSDLIDKGYLKSIPTVGSLQPGLIDDAGCSGCTGGTTSAVGMYLGTTSDSRAVCEAVARQTGQAPSGQAYDPPTRGMVRGDQATSSGCTRIGSEYYAFSFL